MYTYLLINLFTLLVSFIPALILEKKIGYLKNFKFISIALITNAVPFLIWDHYFTVNEVWGFNEKYLIGLEIKDLPIEEILFFFFIPFATIFIYVSYNSLINKPLSKELTQAVAIFIIILTFCLAILNTEKAYTFGVSSLLSFFMTVFLILDTKLKFLSKFFIMYLISLIPFFIVNGLLTHGISNIDDGPVVWYNNTENLGIRIGTIPLEDTLYSMLMLIIPIGIYEFLTKKYGDKNI